MTEPLLGRVAVLLACILAISLHAPSWAADPRPTPDGTCSAADFRVAWGGVSELPASQSQYRVTVLREGAVLYEKPTGSDRVKVLKFNDKAFVRAHDTDRLGVALEGERSIVGWMQRRDLLCAKTPLESAEYRLERKAVIRTQLASQKQGPQVIRAYPTAEMAECQPSCRELTRFRMYFIAAQTNDAFLLAESAILRQTQAILVGWVKKEHVFEWPWALALRGAESLRYEGAAGTICAYLDLADMRAEKNLAPEQKKKCQPILGGPIWFQSEYRLLIRDIRDDYYEVIAPVDGFGQVNSADKGKIAFNPAQLRGLETGTDTIRSLNNIDVLFVIDGTQSMRPWIDEIVGRNGKTSVVRTIADQLAAKTAGGVKYRFGFSIYRDTTTDPRSTGLPARNSKDRFMWDGTCDAGESQLVANRAEFDRNLAAVQVSTDDPTDDFPENTYGAIANAINEVSMVCPKNLKIIIVIGDAGYDADAQRKRGHTPVELSTIVKGLEESKTTTVPFFIRVADDPNKVGNKLYKDAYDSFRTQSVNILEGVSSKLRYERPRMFFDLKTSEGPAKLTDIASNVKYMAEVAAQPEAINEIIIDMRGGMSLQQAIERLRANRKDTIPGFFYGLLENQKCKELGAACTEQIYNTVRELYISKDEKVEIDVLMKLSQLEVWSDIFRPLLDIDANLEQLRERFITAIVKSLETIIAEPTWNDLNEKIGDYMRRAGGLPMSTKSTLLNYSIDDLKRADRVHECEIIALIDWVRGSRQMLKLAQSGDKLAQVELIKPTGSCTFSIGAEKLRIPAGAVEARDLGGNKATIRWPMYSDTYYWVPENYLP